MGNQDQHQADAYDAAQADTGIRQVDAAFAERLAQEALFSQPPSLVDEPETSYQIMVAFGAQSSLCRITARSVEAAIQKAMSFEGAKRAYHYPIRDFDPEPAKTEPDPPSSIAATALRVLNASAELGDGLAQLARAIDVVVTERDALRKVLEDIVHEYDQTYDADGDNTGRWTGAASIPVAVMLRAQRVLAVRS